MKPQLNRQMSRRNFLRLSSGLVAGALLIGYVPPMLQPPNANSGKNPFLLTHLEENTSDANFRAGSTPIGATAWRFYEFGTIFVDVDTSTAGFTNTPFYLTSLGGYHSHYKTVGASSIYYPKSNGFRIYVRDPDRPELTPEDANEMGWHIIWLGIEKIGSSGAGSTPIGSTAWLPCENANGSHSPTPTPTPTPCQGNIHAIFVDVDTSTAGFANTPFYITSLGGYHSHYNSVGASSIYDPKSNGVRIYIQHPTINFTRNANEIANEMGWHVKWLGIEKIGSSRAGSTPIRHTAWQFYEPGTIYVDVDTSAAGFTNTPFYFTSLGGYHRHYTSQGVTSVYYPKSNGFRIYIGVTQFTFPEAKSGVS